MEIRRREGAKTEFGKDMVIEISTNGWDRITNEDVFKLIKMFYDNEEEIYPRSQGFQGGDKFKEAVFQLFSNNMTAEKCAEIANKKGVYKSDFGFDPNKWVKISCDRCGGEVICEKCHNKYVWANIDEMNKYFEKKNAESKK